ncbi:glycosyltransferase family protein [Kribbella jiaozuonensis]|uniref:Glycosyltransferase family 1 protein n=1 Tax=Kribbella jiaozuonensis TaxID=2575441 RepID=A0A4U3LU90_9ACTN|nr:glycosyltransferase family 1 protein [Kribbella jiaozuonensis]TKK78296.1 glycosyltransferase family 1 protein [Kribbella jiaozuonensis]
MICLLPHCAYLSETSRMLELHRALTALGIEVRVATHGGPHERLLTEAGIEYDVIGPGLSATRAAAFVGSAVGLGDPRQSMYDDAEIRTYIAAEAEYFRAHGITVAVTGFTLTTLLSSRLTGVRVITEHAGSFVPPVFERRLLPAPTHPVDPRLKHAPDWLARFLINRSPNRITAYCGGFNRVASELGVEQIPSLAALLLGDLSLVPEVPEVLGISAADLAAWTPGKGYRAGARLRAVGPLFAQLNLPMPARVQSFLDRPGPTIYLAMTSTPPAQVRTAIAELSRLDVRILVAGTIHDLGDLATDRILIDGVLPSHLVMPQVDLAVTTGGQGSVQTAMASGTPLLGIPLHIEQDLNIVLVERLGAARRASTLTELATQMLDTETHHEAAERIQKLYAAANGPADAAEAIAEQL